MAEPIEKIDKLNNELDKELKKKLNKKNGINAEEEAPSKTNQAGADNNPEQQNSGQGTEESKAPKPQPEEQNGNRNPEQPETPKPQHPTDGVSRAYDLPESELYDKPVEKKKKKEKQGWDSKPPERKKGGKGGSGKDIMEVFWNEFIIASFDWVCDTVVDTALNFVDWVLFAPYGRTDKTTSDGETQKKSVYAIGDGLYTDGVKRLDAENEKIVELNDNLGKANAGLQPEWKKWKKEPPFFRKLFAVYKKGMEDQNSPEADFLRKMGFGENNEVIADKFKKEKALFMTANRIATLEEAAKGSQHSISLAFSQNLNELSDKIKQKNTDVTSLKTDIKQKMDALAKEVPGDSATEKKIMEEINAVNELIQTKTDASEINKAVAEHVKNIRKINKQAGNGEDEEMIAKRIQKNSRAVYKKLMENIDKIEEASRDNPEQAAANIKNYLTAINEANKQAKTAVDKVLSNGIKEVFRADKNKKAAATAMANVNSVIDNFEFDGKPLSQRQDAGLKDEFVLTEEKITEATKNYRLNRSR